MTRDGAQDSRFHGLAQKLVVAPFQHVGGRGGGGVGAEPLRGHKGHGLVVVGAVDVGETLALS